MTQEGWQLTADGPGNYEQYQVPSIFEPLARIFLHEIALRPGQSVLDVACGTGIVGRLAAPVVGVRGRIVGVDLNAGMLAVARKNAPAGAALLEWRQGDALALPCADREFDAVLCQQGLQQFPDRVVSDAEGLRKDQAS